MKKFYSMSDSEMAIMQVIWESDAPITAAELLVIFKNKNWKSQTMSTFLSRLVDKGLLKSAKQGKANVYTPVSDEKGYRRLEAKHFVDSMYNGSVQTFLATLYGEEKVDAKQLDELKQWFDEVSKDD